MERWIEWCNEHEKLVMAAMSIGALILGPVLYCLAANGYLNLIMMPFGYLLQAMNWICGC